MLLTIAAFAVMIGVLIFVHESGHFLAAKAVGIQVHRFSLGFGKPILSFRRGETEYCISALPFGGYVKMAGLEDEGMMGEVEGGASPVPVDPARAFDKKPLWARIIVILAGVTMNMILAYVVLVGMAAVTGLPELSTTQIDSVRVADLPRGAEALSQLHFGDRISRIDGAAINGWVDIERAILRDSAPVEIAVAGRPELIRITPGDGSLKDRTRILEAITPLQSARMGLIQPGRPAYRAGAKPGDVVIRAEGDTVRGWSDFLHRIWAAPGRSLHVDVIREGVVVPLVITPDSATEGDSIPGRPAVYGQIGVVADPAVRHVREPLGRALSDGASQLVFQTVGIVGGLRDLVLGRLSIRRALSGPVAIAQVSGQTARLGSDWYLGLLLTFSVNLAVLNLLPIPILDGGQLMFLIAEGVRRKPLSLALRLRLTQIGFFFIVALMLFVVGNDVLNLIPVRDLLTGYLAGRIKADRVVAAVAAAYYQEQGAARERWQPLIDVIERGAPGVVELAGTSAGKGFEVRLAERPLPSEHEPALRRAAEVVLAGLGSAEVESPVPTPGFFARIAQAVRRIFS